MPAVEISFMSIIAANALYRALTGYLLSSKKEKDEFSEEIEKLVKEAEQFNNPGQYSTYCKMQRQIQKLRTQRPGSVRTVSSQLKLKLFIYALPYLVLLAVP